jgi:hypothetical protein
MYAIRRVNRAITAWCWTFEFTRRGTLYTKHFFDGSHGGSKKALSAAIAWRDKKLAEIDILTIREFCQQKRSNNTSGVPGVHFLRSARQPLGLWQAKVTLRGGRKVHRSFSVLRFGEREAFRRAVAARAQLLLLIDDRPYLKHRTARRLRQEEISKAR